MSILAVKYQNPSKTKTWKPTTLLERKRNSLTKPLSLTPKQIQSINWSVLHMESWERKGNSRNLGEAYFPILWFVPIFHFPGPRSPFTVARSPFQLVTTKWRNKGEGGGGGLHVLIKMTQKHIRALIKYKTSQHLVGQTSHILSLRVLYVLFCCNFPRPSARP